MRVGDDGPEVDAGKGVEEYLGESKFQGAALAVAFGAGIVDVDHRRASARLADGFFELQVRYPVARLRRGCGEEGFESGYIRISQRA